MFLAPHLVPSTQFKIKWELYLIDAGGIPGSCDPHEPFANHTDITRRLTGDLLNIGIFAMLCRSFSHRAILQIVDKNNGIN
jgi:hypothetical protein